VLVAAALIVGVACGGGRALDGTPTPMPATASAQASPAAAATGTASAEATSTATPTSTAARPPDVSSARAPAAGPPRTLVLQPALGGRRFERPT
jgi:hypothetical protein